MSLRKPVVVESIRDKVYEALLSAILSGELKPGQQVTLNYIASSLQVSTMPVREALRRLEAQGLVSFTSNKRIVITKITYEELKEYYWIRIPLECKAFERNILKLQNGEISRLKELHDLMGGEGIDSNQWVCLNKEFHMILYGANGSPVLKGVLDLLWSKTTVYLNLYAKSGWGVETANASHSRIIEALERNDKASGVKELRKHLMSGITVVGPLLNKL
jgi:DNA-binding GntR family transcriptional regulator